ALLAGAWVVQSEKPQNKRRGPTVKPALNVEVQQITPQDLQLTLQSYGLVSAKTRSPLTVQVSGEITEIAPAFEPGAFFKKGDLLLTLDKRDYQSAVNSAKASLTQAQQELRIEQAQVKQAQADWKRLGNRGKAPDLVSRKPQELIAKAKVSAAYANFNQAVTNLQRSKLSAPFDGRVISRDVNTGQFVNANTQVGEIFATETVEVRLPLQNSDLGFISLPNDRVNQTPAALPKVRFTSDLASAQQWHGALTKTEATIDESTQQLYVIARIDNPFHSEEPGLGLKIGQYIKAEIQGKQLEDVIAIPIATLYQGAFVYLVRDGVLHKTDVAIRWKNDKLALIGRGLNPGDLLVTTTLAQVPSGTRVNVTSIDGRATADAAPADNGGNAQ
ncbi:MAG: efflux RND transporter periplasmic adaptor subunit, partial [Pseudomonadales bacterium]